MSLKSILFFLYSCTFMWLAGLAMITSHFKCRGGLYPRSTVQRFFVPDDKVSWSTDYAEYKPNNYTSPAIFNKPWADPEIEDPDFLPKWNQLDDKVDRRSYTGEYDIANGFPRNPVGRTGISGRGVLGRWGPNHAADPVVTRWKKFETADRPQNRILQFVAIKRSDTGEWALPGGMVDPGEKVASTAVREFQEEAVNSLLKSDDEKEKWRLEFEKFFSEGDEVYRGYVDDRRNTDNAWMETVAFNFHDEKGEVVGALELNAGDDAVGVRWVDIVPGLKLYANHEYIVGEVLKRRLPK